MPQREGVGESHPVRSEEATRSCRLDCDRVGGFGDGRNAVCVRKPRVSLLVFGPVPTGTLWRSVLSGSNGIVTDVRASVVPGPAAGGFGAAHAAITQRLPTLTRNMRATSEESKRSLGDFGLFNRRQEIVMAQLSRNQDGVFLADLRHVRCGSSRRTQTQRGPIPERRGAPAPAMARYEIEISEHANREIEALRPFDRRPVVQAIRALSDQAETPTRNRKLLRSPIEGFPLVTWQLRVGRHRVFYEILPPATVHILRVIIKEGTTAESL